MLRFNIVQGTLNERGNYGMIPFGRHYIILMCCNADVKLTPENQVTVETKRDDPLGAELEPMDPSISGSPVRIDKVRNRRK